MENLFTLDGASGHEIVFVFQAEFVDPAAYEVERWTILDDPTGRTVTRWRDPNEADPRLVPAGIERFMSPDPARGGA
ncbi:MAG: hypothetical protein AAGD35_11750 [Actinomycetota bacterium]